MYLLHPYYSASYAYSKWSKFWIKWDLKKSMSALGGAPCAGCTREGGDNQKGGLLSLWPPLCLASFLALVKLSAASTATVSHVDSSGQN